METRKRITARFFSVLAIGCFAVLGAREPAAASICSEGVGVPPFLSQGEDPNVLMIIDNSASMYDLAYIPAAAASQGYCFDESFVSGTTYAGYFETGQWYSYDLTNDKFVPVADQAAMTTACNAAAGTKYTESNGHVCVKLDMAAPVDSQVKYFGASSNFLNWVASSKFDLEKKVLTGGKYVNDPIAAGKYLMVMESRGCNEKTFFKQVSVSDGTNALKMALGVRAEAQTTTAPVSNYLTRIDIHQITTKGISFAACQAAIDNFLDIDGDGRDADGNPINQASIRTSAEACLVAACPTWSLATPCAASASKNAFNAIMQECWYNSKQGHFQPGGGSVTSMKPKCEAAYNITNPPTAPPAGYVSPASLSPTDICFGVYGAGGTGTGWVGKCLEPTMASGAAFIDIECTIETPNGSSAAPPGNLASPYTILPDLPLNDKAKFCATNLTPHVWKYCSGTYAGPAGGKSCNKPWLTAQKADPAPATVISSVDWTDDLGDTKGYNCIDAVLREYCGDMDEPGVPDPSDAKSSQDITFNIPAFLVLAAGESHVGKSLLAMKGLVERSTIPTGILHQYANDIRFGTMAFNAGTFAECMPIKRHADNTQYVANLYDCLTQKGTAITAASTPDPTKLDGAAVKTYIGKGAKHFEALVNAANEKGINNIVATTWTPTAEAYYNAIGYYTQKSELRINPSDYYVNSVDAVAKPLWVGDPSTHYAGSRDNPVYVRDANNKMYMTFDDGWSSPKQADGLTASTGPADDGSTTLTWIPIDPVVNYCQSNNILILTDGASTADERGSNSFPVVPATANVVNFAVTNGDPASAYPRETTTATTYDCGALNGSTLLDDLSYYGFNGSIYPLSKTWTNEETGLPVTGKNIQSFIVSTGTPRVVTTAGLPAECDSTIQLTKAATNGGSTQLYTAESSEALAAALKKIFDAIKAGTSSGSASSVISASRGGEGAIYQAIFWPKQTSIDDPIQWIGDVHALLIDSYGGMYEDDGYVYGLLPRSYTKRQLSNSSAAGERYTNTKVTLFFDKSPGVNQAMACNGTLEVDDNGTVDTRDDVQVCNGIKKELKKVHYLWSAADWLASITAADIKSNRTTYVSMEKKRYVYTWIDLNSDGAVDAATEWLPFTEAANLGAKAKSPATRGPVTLDFGVAPMPADNIDVNDIVNWVRGYDFVAPSEHTPIPLGDPVPVGKYPTRSRQRNYSFDPDWDWATTPSAITWRMSDVIHSTPTAVTRPSEGYHLLYKDLSYAAFIDRYNKRRHMIYFGSNGGMLHAVNGGFYDDVNKRFCRTVDCNNEGDPQGAALPNGSPELGAEMWAYVPYNLLPHLKCLMARDYTDHKYYVDLRPRVFDVRLWDPADVGTHYNGWGTIMVVGMRFGGSPVEAKSLDLDGNGAADYPLDNRKFASSYIIFDITDPEQPPVLLGELNHTTDNLYASMGYSTVMPTVVPMKLGNAISDWYLILGSGPTDVAGNLDGRSGQPAKLAVYDLKKLLTTPAPFRINNDLPTVLNNQNGRWELADPNSFISDLITVDFELNTDYMADAVYFGTVSGDWGNWGGKMYRLVTRKMNANIQEKTEPSQWSGLLATNPKLLFNAGRPVTAAAAVGTDYINHWVYFGTGRFFDRNDKSDNSSNALQSYYGIKEPKDCSGAFTWEEVEKNAGVGPAGPGSLGLRNVTQVRVLNSSPASSATLFCDPNLLDTSCLPVGVTTFDKLIKDIAGKGRLCAAGSVYGTDGWYRELTTSRERNLGQATLLGGLLTFTTYQPFLNLCLPEGLGFLYGLYFQTGTPWHKAVFSNQAINTSVEFKIDMGRGLSTTPNIHIGKEEGGKAFAQTSTGAIVEIEQPNLPFANVKTGREDWRQIKPAIR